MLPSPFKSQDISLGERLGLSYAGYYGTSFESFLKVAAAQGFRHVQLTPDQSPNLFSEFDDNRIDNLRELSQSLGIQLHLHNVFYDINLASVIPEVQDFALSVTSRVSELASKIGADTLTIHPGYRFPGWRRSEQEQHFWSAAKRGLELLAEISTQTKVKFLLENGSYYLTTASGQSRTPLHMAIEPEELCRLCEMTSGQINVALDLNKVRASRFPLSAFVHLLGSRIQQFQFSNASNDEAEEKEVKEVLLNADYMGAVIFFEGQIKTS